MLTIYRYYGNTFFSGALHYQLTGYYEGFFIGQGDIFPRFNCRNCGQKSGAANDTGDDTLRMIAVTLKAALRRPADLVARYGGEEFVCVLPETSYEDAMNLATELERKVRDRAIPHENSPVANVVTISVGVATRDGNTDGDAPAHIGLADNQLYRAKHTGRARVCGAILTQNTAIN